MSEDDIYIYIYIYIVQRKVRPDISLIPIQRTGNYDLRSEEEACGQHSDSLVVDVFLRQNCLKFFL